MCRKRRHTTLAFHLPRLNTKALTTASVENEVVIAANTPTGPTENTYASRMRLSALLELTPATHRRPDRV